MPAIMIAFLFLSHCKQRQDDYYEPVHEGGRQAVSTRSKIQPGLPMVTNQRICKAKVNSIYYIVI
jgi:hypothetical protein